MKSRMYEHSMQLLKRLDDQYDKVNTKISLYIAVNTAFLAGLGVIFKEYEIYKTQIAYPLIISAILFVLSILLLIYAASPYLPKKKSYGGDIPQCSIAQRAVKITIRSGHILRVMYCFKKQYIKIMQPIVDNIKMASYKIQKFFYKQVKNKPKPSLIYFYDIAGQKSDFFNKYCSLFGVDVVDINLDKNDKFLNNIISDIIAQIYLLSIGLKRRNHCLKFVSFIMSLAIGIIGILLCLFMYSFWENSPIEELFPNFDLIIYNIFTN